MQILFYETNEEDKKTLIGILRDYPNIEAKYLPDILSAENINADIEAISVFVGSEVRKAQIDSMPKLKLITTRSTGFDHIDIEYAKSKNITVCNVPAYGSRTVAEFTFSLILGISRKTFLAYKQIKDQHDFSIEHFEGFDLQGKTLGVIGTGRIGQNVIQIAHGFNMNILGYDAFKNPELEKKLNFKYVSLNELLVNSDIVTLHVPYNKTTHYLINQENIKSFKPGAALINTSRGEVVDTNALLYGIKNKIISAAGLDVLEGERELKEEAHLLSEYNNKKDLKNLMQIKILLADHLLMENPAVALTPHIAFFSKEAKHEILKITVENIMAFSTENKKNLV